MPRPTRNSAWVVVPRWSRPAARAARLDRGDVDVGGQVLAADVDVRVVVDAMAEVGAERAVAAPDRVVELGRGVAVVDEQQDAALEAGRRRVHPGIERRGRSPRAGPRRAGRTPSVRRAARAGVVGSASTSTNAPSRDPTRISRRAPSRTTTRWTGRASRTSLARTKPVIGAALACGRDEGDRRGRPPPGARRWPRAGAARPRSGRSAGAPRDPDARRPGRRGRRARASRSRRRIRAARTGPAGRAGPRRPRRPGRARRRRSGAPPGRSGSRRRDRGARPRPGSSRRRGRTGRGP